MGSRLNLVGKRFGKLLVIAFSHIEKRNNKSLYSWWKCICDCGKTTLVRGHTLTGGLTKSCGCLLGCPLNAKEAAVNYILIRYKQQARKRNLCFKLSKEQFKDLIFSKCHYCNSDFTNEVKAYHRSYKDGIKYNGIDRKNNSKGYEEDNCVTCCKICNFLKKDKSYEEFLLLIKKIYENRRLNEFSNEPLKK